MTDPTRDDPWDDEAPSEEELLEARLLARALERETLPGGDVDALRDALEAGHLLRAARAPELSPDRLDALFATLEASLPETPPSTPIDAAAPEPGLRRLRAWWFGLSLTAVAALLLVVLLREPAKPAVVGAALPPPSLEVLEAQLGALQRVQEEGQRDAGDAGERGSGDAPEPRLARAMQPYRSELLARLEAEYAR